MKCRILNIIFLLLLITFQNRENKIKEELRIKNYNFFANKYLNSLRFDKIIIEKEYRIIKILKLNVKFKPKIKHIITRKEF